MSEWYEVFDHAEVLLAMQRRAGRLVALFALAGGALVALAPLLVGLPFGGVLVAAVAVALVVAALHVAQAIRALRCVVWCVKLSVHRVVGHDCGRRRAALAWEAVERVELDRDGLLLVGRDEGGVSRRLRVPHAFPDYARLSHRVVEYAEAFGRPVFVDGRPWQLLDLHEVYPFLREGDRVQG